MAQMILRQDRLIRICEIGVICGSWFRRLFAFMLLGGVLLHPGASVAQDAFADAVHSYTPGTNGGFGADRLPDVILGPPLGSALLQGSFDVVALGIGGSMVLRFDLPVICDGPGPDFTVFENAFHSGSPTGPVFAEFGFVSVSQDGVGFVDFPYDPVTHAGLAGQTPVLSHPDNDIDPLDPVVSGGDSFDLATVGLSWVAYVRVTDVAGAIADPGDLPQFTVAPNAGFDLDAVAALHGCDPSTQVTPTPTATIVPVTATPTRTRAPSMPGDLDGDGVVTEADAVQLVAEIFDGDGDAVSAAAGGSTVSGVEADVNADARITAADLTALGRLSE